MIGLPGSFSFTDFLKNNKLWEKAKIRKQKLTSKYKGSGNVYQDCVIINFVKPLESHVNELHENNIEFTKEGLIEDEIEREMYVLSNESVNKVKNYINYEDFLIIKSANNILFYEHKNDSKNAMTCYQVHVKKFGDRGKKIYNLLESGYFEKLFLPFLIDMESQKKKNLTISKEFQSFFDRFIGYNPTAIWVNNNTKMEDMYLEIFARLINQERKGMYVYGRKQININKIKKVLNKFIKEYSNFEYYVQEREIRSFKACEFR